MSQSTTATTTIPASGSIPGRTAREEAEPVDAEVVEFRRQFEEASPLDELVRKGARRMLQTAIEAEVDDFITQHADRRDEAGRRQVVRNGRLPAREILTGAGPLSVSQPRVRDKSPVEEDRVSFSPSVLPPYLRRSKAIEEPIPWLYLKGVSTGDFGEALQALVGEQAKGLSANVIVRLCVSAPALNADTEQWSGEYDDWMKRDLSDKHYVYLWADGIYAKVRLEDDANNKQCLLVLMGRRGRFVRAGPTAQVSRCPSLLPRRSNHPRWTADGHKELISVQDGYRESEQSWSELLLDLKHRGLAIAPQLAVGDGALGFWAALRKVFPEVKEQRCWVHKTANVLSKMPRSVQPKAKADLQEIWQAETREEANRAFDHFLEKYGAKYEAACQCLKKDRDVLLTFYDFPAEH